MTDKERQGQTASDRERWRERGRWPEGGWMCSDVGLRDIQTEKLCLQEQLVKRQAGLRQPAVHGVRGTGGVKETHNSGPGKRRKLTGKKWKA